ncbi:MAG: hypothetical protein KGZ87_06145 [Bacteroidetes bacterium]|nr:hypothetical protein [Bacteroidota bacterium]
MSFFLFEFYSDLLQYPYTLPVAFSGDDLDVFGINTDSFRGVFHSGNQNYLAYGEPYEEPFGLPLGSSFITEAISYSIHTSSIHHPYTIRTGVLVFR